MAISPGTALGAKIEDKKRLGRVSELVTTSLKAQKIDNFLATVA